MSEPTIANLEARLAAIDARLTARATEGGARDEQAERALQRERLDAALSLAWELGMSDPARCRALSLAAQSRAEALGYDRGRALAGRNLGYLNLFGDGLEQAFQDVLAARDMLAALEDPRGVADCEDVLANIFLRLDALDRALEHSARCLELNERLGNQRGVGWAHHNLGLVHQRMGDGAAAEQEYKQAAACFQAIGHDHGLARIEGLLAHTLVERGELAAAAQAHARAIRLWGDNRLAGYSHISAARLHLDHGHGELTTAREHIARAREIGEGLDVPDMHAAIELLHARALLREGPEAQAEAERVLVALLENEAYQTVFARGGVFTTEREALELLAERCERRGEFERALRFLRRRVERERATVDADSRARARNMQISMGVAAAEREAQVVERLLLNTLPRPIVRELRLRGRVAPVHHAHATVLFTDFVGFTRIAAALEPAALVDELDRLFTDFDAIAQRRGLEKLKTIGDAYMAAAGVPTPRPYHALAGALAALEMCEVVRARAREREAQGLEPWGVRVGLSSGPLVAGVIGRDKFAYDVWGDTVNTAARMESSGAPGRVNVSRATRALLDPCFVCTHRGRLAAKSKGLVDMYFVERIAPEYAEDADGRVPNARLLAMLEPSS